MERDGMGELWGMLGYGVPLRAPAALNSEEGLDTQGDLPAVTTSQCAVAGARARTRLVGHAAPSNRLRKVARLALRTPTRLRCHAVTWRHCAEHAEQCRAVPHLP